MEKSDFSKIYWINKNIDRWRKKLEELEISSSIKSASRYQTAPAYGTNAKSDNTAKIVQRKLEIQEKINDLIKDAYVKRLEIYEYIKKIGKNDPYMAAIIEERCIECKTWIEVADTLGGNAKAHEKAYHRYMDRLFIK